MVFVCLHVLQNLEVIIYSLLYFIYLFISDSNSTGQRVEVHVNYEVGEEKAPTSDITLWAGITGLILLILSVLIFICFLDRPKSSRSSTALDVQNVAAPQTPDCPDRSNHAPQNERSPRTPQPFIDYVRRTIDETPYYTRQRRRFDPQNTY